MRGWQRVGVRGWMQQCVALRVSGVYGLHRGSVCGQASAHHSWLVCVCVVRCREYVKMCVCVYVDVMWYSASTNPCICQHRGSLAAINALRKG